MNEKQEMKFCLVRNILVCKIKQYLIFHVKLLSIPYLFQLIKKLFKKRKRIKENAGKKWSLTISNLSWQKPGKKFRTAFVFDHTISHRFNYNQVSPNLKFPPFQIEYSQFSNSRRARLRRFNFPRFRFAHNSTDIPPLPRPPLPPLFFREIRATSNSNVGYGFEGGRDSSRYPLFPLPLLPSLLLHLLLTSKLKIRVTLYRVTFVQDAILDRRNCTVKTVCEKERERGRESRNVVVNFWFEFFEMKKFGQKDRKELSNNRITMILDLIMFLGWKKEYW